MAGPPRALASVIGLALLACGCPPAGERAPAREDAAKRREAPAEAVLLDIGYGKPPLRSYGVNLTLHNRHDRDIWLLWSDSIDMPLPPSGVFSAAGASPVPFGGEGLAGVGGEVVVVKMHGTDSFHAVHLPPRARVVLAGFGLSAWKPVDRFELWEVAALRINDGVPLERWLPYPTMSGDDVIVGLDALREWQNLDWDDARGRTRRDYPSDPVQVVTAEIVDRWQIPIEGADAKNADRRAER